MSALSVIFKTLKQKLLIVIRHTINHISYTSDWHYCKALNQSCGLVMWKEYSIPETVQRKSNAFAPPSLCICQVIHYWLWGIKNYNVSLASSGWNLVSDVGREGTPAPHHTHAHCLSLTHTHTQNMDYIKSLVSFLKERRQTKNKQQRFILISPCIFEHFLTPWRWLIDKPKHMYGVFLSNILYNILMFKNARWNQKKNHTTSM
jgi:hypothetical protein